MMEDNTLSYDEICKHIGKLYLESSIRLDTALQKNAEVTLERDRLLNMLKSKETPDGSPRT